MCLSGNILISPSFLRDFFADYRIFDWQVFFHLALKCLLTASDLYSFWWEVSCIWWMLLIAFKSLSLSWDFNSLCCVFGMVLFKFLLLGVHWTSWRCRLIFFIKFEIFGDIISSSILSAPFSLSPLFLELSLYIHVSLLNSITEVS